MAAEVLQRKTPRPPESLQIRDRALLIKRLIKSRLRNRARDVPRRSGSSFVCDKLGFDRSRRCRLERKFKSPKALEV